MPQESIHPLLILSAQRLGFSGELTRSLCERYSEHQRHYHTTLHLYEVLTLSAIRLAHLPEREHRLLDVALWFHDAIYKTTPYTPGQNERLSAELMLREAVFLSEDDRATCQRLILLTANHQPSEQPLAAEMLCCDLGILAADSPRYAEYTRQIKQEFQAVDPLVFQRGRCTVLQHFLELAQQRRLFTAAFWPDTDHDRAIDNLSRELAMLA